MSITKSIEDIEVTFSVTDDNSVTRTDVVTHVRYVSTLMAADNVGKFVHNMGVSLDTSDLSTFTEYSSLTEANLITMCENKIGSSTVTEIQTSLNAQKTEYENPTKEIRQLSS